MGYIRKTRDVYKLWWKGEVIDTAETKVEARYLVREYNLAYGGGVTFRRGREVRMNEVIAYCEKYGIYEIYSQKGSVITYYSYFGREGFYKVTHNCKTGYEKRKHLRFKTVPKFLVSKGLRYNYFCG